MAAAASSIAPLVRTLDSFSRSRLSLLSQFGQSSSLSVGARHHCCVVLGVSLVFTAQSPRAPVCILHLRETGYPFTNTKAKVSLSPGCGRRHRLRITLLEGSKSKGKRRATYSSLTRIINSLVNPRSFVAFTDSRQNNRAESYRFRHIKTRSRHDGYSVSERGRR